eukprot:jgi/Botrbrau1/10422/Bobra.0133s0029.1
MELVDNIRSLSYVQFGQAMSSPSCLPSEIGVSYIIEQMCRKTKKISGVELSESAAFRTLGFRYFMLFERDMGLLDAGRSGSSDGLDALVQSQLTGLSPVTFAVVFAAGLLTSLSPCTLSVLPLTIGYIGGYSTDGKSAESGLTARALAFSFGLATTLALLGVVSTYFGKAYGQIGQGLPIAVSLIAVVMGLNLLEVVQLRLPSLDVDVRDLPLPPIVTAYLAGLTFALAASPCSTPVLATLLAYVASTKDPLSGGALLLSYTSGYVVPLLLAATVTGAMKQVLELRQWSAWVTPVSGFLLLSGGVYGFLSRVLPA